MHSLWLPRAIRVPLMLGAVIAIVGRAPLGGDRVVVAAMQPEIFGESAAYERFMGRWSGRLAPLLVQFAGIRDGDSILDVGSGTGALAFAIAKATVAGLTEQLGWEVADMGGAEAARAIEPLCMLWCIPGFLRNEWTHAFKLLRA